MNDIRILIPWDRLTDDLREAWNPKIGGFYDRAMEPYTRPITPEDIRSCLRMPDEWTKIENVRFASDIVAHEYKDIDSDELAQCAIDIATRYTPAHKPCPFCGGEGVYREWDEYDEHHHAVRCGGCRFQTSSCCTEAEAWAAWDRRADEKAPSVAPMLDPWEEMDRVINADKQRAITNYPFTTDMNAIVSAWTKLKKAEGK